MKEFPLTFRMLDLEYWFRYMGFLASGMTGLFVERWIGRWFAPANHLLQKTKCHSMKCSEGISCLI